MSGLYGKAHFFREQTSVVGGDVPGRGNLDVSIGETVRFHPRQGLAAACFPWTEFPSTQ